MLEVGLLGVFSVSLVLCVALERSVLWALCFGYALFFCYGLSKGRTPGEMLRLSLSGVRTIRGILVTFAFIGALTAVWRVCGTIPFLVYHAARLCAPSVMALMTFLLCCAVSYLTGTAFGAAATIGVICVTMANGMGVPLLFSGGAMLAGVFFGDRCSPMSTSALLVCELTGTDIFQNIRGMVRTSLAPFLASCAFFLSLGLLRTGGGGAQADMRTLFAAHFTLSPWTALPAAVILVFSALRRNVRFTMGVSILTGAAVALLTQHTAPAELLRVIALGYRPEDAALSALLAGGGLLSMARTFAIVCLSSSYAGMFGGTGFLDGIQGRLRALEQVLTPFGGMLLTAALTSMVSCNQTLAIMLTHQLCGTKDKEPSQLALDLENTAVIVPPLVPWSIASAVPLASVGAPAFCCLTAVYLWLLPLWGLFCALQKGKRSRV